MIDERFEHDVTHLPVHHREHREVAVVEPREHVPDEDIARVRGESFQEWHARVRGESLKDDEDVPRARGESFQEWLARVRGETLEEWFARGFALFETANGVL